MHPAALAVAIVIGAVGAVAAFAISAGLHRIATTPQNRRFRVRSGSSDFRDLSPVGCAICLDTKTSMTRVKLSCQHEFHPECLRLWHQETNTNRCPVCYEGNIQ